jgi:hypothetical protein
MALMRREDEKPANVGVSQPHVAGGRNRRRKKVESLAAGLNTSYEYTKDDKHIKRCGTEWTLTGLSRRIKGRQRPTRRAIKPAAQEALPAPPAIIGDTFSNVSRRRRL